MDLLFPISVLFGGLTGRPFKEFAEMGDIKIADLGGNLIDLVVRILEQFFRYFHSVGEQILGKAFVHFRAEQFA